MYRFQTTAVLPLAGFVLRPGAFAARVRSLTPVLALAAVLAYGPLALFMDSRLTAAWPGEYVLGAATFAVLWLCTRALDATDRRLTWMCVAVATGFEILGSLVWGAYRYRFGGIPLFVPFGHGLIYAFGARLAATRWVRSHEAPFTRAVFCIAVIWAIGGVTFLPPLTGRYDAHGLLWLPIFACAVLLGPRKAFFASLFIATTDIELAGTWLRTWAWAPTTPWLHVSSGNPPSAIAGGYAVIDGSVLQLFALISTLRAAWSRLLRSDRAQLLRPNRVELGAAA
jgi:hypothetical protein